jgi:hypothetical protein
LVARSNRENLTSDEFHVFVSPVSVSQPCPPRTKMPPRPCPVVKLKTSFSSRPSSPRPENLPPRPARWLRPTGVNRPRSHPPPISFSYRELARVALSRHGRRRHRIDDRRPPRAATARAASTPPRAATADDRSASSRRHDRRRHRIDDRRRHLAPPRPAPPARLLSPPSPTPPADRRSTHLLARPRPAPPDLTGGNEPCPTGGRAR